MAAIDAAIHFCMKAETIQFDAQADGKLCYRAGISVGFESGKGEMLIVMASVHAQHNNIFVYQEPM